MTKVPHVVMISPEFPAPLTSGGKKRTFHLLRALAHLGPVDLITFAERPEAEATLEMQAICRHLEILPLRRHSKRLLPFLWRNVRRVIRGVNPLIDRFSEREICEAVRQALSRDTYDLIVLEHSWIAHYIPMARRIQPRARIILDCHNLESELWRQYAEGSPAEVFGLPPDRLTRDPFRSALFRVAARRFWRSALWQERTYLPQADAVWVVSEVEAERAAALAPEAHIWVIPNGTTPRRDPHAEDIPGDTPGPPPGPSPRSQDRDRHATIGFVGTMRYPPNEEGVCFFLDAIWPLIRRAVSNVRLMLIGQATPRVLRRVQTDDHIQALGEVPDVTPYLDQWALMVVPLLRGGGTRMKILDAWAHGVAVVSTSKGIEGIRAVHREHVWIADSPEDFASAVIYLLHDDHERERLARRGYERAKELYDWDVIAERLLNRVRAFLSASS